MLLKCSCKQTAGGSTRGARYQDQKYAPGVRVHNPTATLSGRKLNYRCTICGTTRTTGAPI